MCASHRKEAVEQGVIGIRDGNEALLHDAGIVDDDIDAAKAFFRFVEKRGDFRRNRNIGLYGHSPPAARISWTTFSASAAWPA